MEQLNIYLFHRNDRVHRIKPNTKNAVSYFQNRRWQLITLLEQVCGFWPHQSQLQQYPLRLLHSFLFLTIFSAAAYDLIGYVGVDTVKTIESCLFMLLLFVLFVKLFFASTYQSRRQKVYKRIAEHFEAMNDPEEAAVLNESAESGFKYTLVYMCGISLCIVIFNATPVLRAFYDYFFNHRELEMQMPLQLNFGFDHSKYWYIIAVVFTTWLCSATLTDFAYDLSFMSQVRYAAALFQIVRIRLRKASDLVDEFESEAMSEDVADESYSLVSSAIDLHVRCLDLVKQIEESYTTSWLMILLVNTAGFGAGLYLVSTKLDDLIETIRYSAAFVMVALHFQVIFSQGQIIIDSSSTIADACCECKWYGLPKKSSKLLPMMMMRASIPCQLTGGNLFPLSMKSFSKMFKAGLSYYTLFRPK